MLLFVVNISRKSLKCILLISLRTVLVLFQEDFLQSSSVSLPNDEIILVVNEQEILNKMK